MRKNKLAYSDYGAFVWCDGERRTDKEDVAAFFADEEVFGESSKDISSGARIFVSLLHQKDDEEENENVRWLKHIHHGIMGDGDIRVVCHKQGLPEIWERTNDDFKSVKYFDEDTDPYEYGEINFEYKGYQFRFKSGDYDKNDNHYIAEMTEPDGTFWKCEYDYMFGAGF